MLTKDQKRKFVDDNAKLIDSYGLVGIVPLSGIPDRLLQASRNNMRNEIKFITGKKSLIKMALEKSKKGKELAEDLEGTSAVILSNSNPFELYKKFKEGTIKLAAKPSQIAPQEIIVPAGETTLQPGQAVTELKAAGIDVKIDKGKVVIAKDKVLVPKGSTISLQVAKALHTLDIMPFTASIEPLVMLSGNVKFTKDVFSITSASVASDIASAFAQALSISIMAKIVNSYTVERFVAEAYNNAVALGLGASIYEPGIIEKMVSNAALSANLLNSKI
ncbi:MAG: 50S ribosomal protein L10 [Candidatus Marsarchaeota archaeon]|nr:50S ribosomal protein L10 [Candidatus Marsarchaeota archaeon]